jgi:hypothetical protein
LIVKWKLNRIKGGRNRKLNLNGKQSLVDFSQIVKNAYEKGENEIEMTLEKLIEELKADLKQLVIC